MARSDLERMAKKYEVNFAGESLPGDVRIATVNFAVYVGQRVKEVIPFVQRVNIIRSRQIERLSD